MKVAYKHLVSFIPSQPTIDDVSKKLFQLGHEHEILDNIFLMELTPNRGDCLSINGLLRDLAVFYEISFANEIYEDSFRPLDLEFINNAPKACPHISFLKIDIAGEIRPYKGELKEFFEDLNINKNNFFTDVSNYISYETGQPTHCYDAQKINNKFSLEISNDTHQFETLLKKKLDLVGSNLIFIKENQVINLAGVMGGYSTACTEDTRSVIVECAYFDPEHILGKSLKYDINSEAAHKFERRVDPSSHEKVLRRFLKIVDNHAAITNIEIFKKDYHEFNQIQISTNVERINEILGTSITKNNFEKILTKLKFIFDKDKIVVPSHRGDIGTENDIAEEIARVIGYNNITNKKITIPKIASDYFEDDLEQIIKDLLIDHGFYEVINNPFGDYDSEDAIKIDNPLDSNKTFLRNNLKKSLTANYLYNSRRQQDSIKLFEIADVYYLSDKINNKKILGIICGGKVGKNYKDFSKKIDKSFLFNILKKLSNDNEAISLNSISKEVIDPKLKDEIIYMEVELDHFKNYPLTYKMNTQKKLTKDNFPKYKPISEYPSSIRDLSFSVKNKDKYNELQDLLLNFNDRLIKDIFIFDFYDNNKNNEIKIGFRFIFQSRTSTITELEVNNIMDKIIDLSLQIDSIEIPGLASKWFFILILRYVFLSINMNHLSFINTHKYSRISWWKNIY